MRFRFGWRKEHKRDKQIKELLNEDFELDATDDLPLQEVTMPTRILFFGDHEEIGNLYSLFLRAKGYEVLHFPSPATCAMINKQKCTCPRDFACADILIADMDMEDMSGLEVISHQNERGCRTLPEHKAIISNGLNFYQEREATALGCKILIKPFRLLDLMDWVRRCEENIQPDRKLTSLQELLGVAQA